MSVSGISSTPSYLSLLLGSDTESSDSDSVLARSPTVSRALASAGLSLEDLGLSSYGSATSYGLSDQALSALGLSSSSSSSSTSSTASTADKVSEALSAAGTRGMKVAEVLDSLFSDLTTDEAMNVRDEVGALMGQLQDPTLDATASGVERTTRNGQTTVVTLRGSQGAVLRIEASLASDGSSALRLTYAGSDIGGVDMTVSRAAGEDNDQMTASVVQRETLGNGRLSQPVNTSSYSGAV